MEIRCNYPILRLSFGRRKVGRVRRKWTSIIIAQLLVVTLATTCIGQTLVPLGPIGGDTASAATDINDAGQIVGVSIHYPAQQTDPFGSSPIYQSASWTLDGSSQAVAQRNGAQGQIYAINNSGLMVGWSGGTTSGGFFCLNGGTVQDIPGGTGARAVNYLGIRV